MIIAVMEWIGTVAFAVSGSLVAIGCGLDLFGVLMVGCVTAVGGGMTRDVLLGNVPPQIFFNPLIVLVAFATSLVVFIVGYINFKKFKGMREKAEELNIFFDALGLSAFSVTGVEIACEAGFADNVILAVTMGVLTGVGGGVLRDVLVNEKPYVLVKHVYAVASLAGSGVYWVIRCFTEYRIAGTFIAMALVILLRLLAAKFHWKLPKIKLEETSV